MDNLLGFIHTSGQLKKRKRNGWLIKDVNPQHTESIADHIFRTTLLSFVLSKHQDGDLDTDKCIKLALIHDLPEAICGDITPHDDVSHADKVTQETKAMTELTRLLNDSELHALWQEYESQASPEARFVKQIDKLETLIQAVEYSKLDDLDELAKDFDFKEFWEWADKGIDNGYLRSIMNSLDT